MKPATKKIAPIEERRLTDQLAPLFRRPEIRLAVLFGSAATEQRHRRSDLDLGTKKMYRESLLAFDTAQGAVVQKSEVFMNAAPRPNTGVNGL